MPLKDIYELLSKARQALIYVYEEFDSDEGFTFTYDDYIEGSHILRKAMTCIDDRLLDIEKDEVLK